MHPNGLKDLIRSYSQQGTPQLQEIVGAPPGTYKEESVKAARFVLSQREQGTPDPTIAQAARFEMVASSASERYSDAYITARAINGFGSVIKILAVAFGIMLVIGGFALSADGRNPIWIFGGFVFAVAFGVPIYVLGVLVAAHGQILKATIDTAVHSSPFLSDDQRATVMSIKR